MHLDAENQDNTNLAEEITNLVPGLTFNREGKRRLWFDLEAKGLRDMFKTLKERYRDLHLSTITGLEVENYIEIIYHFAIRKVLVNVKVKVSSSEPRLDTIVDILPVADAYERELHDVLGIEFLGRKSTEPLVLPDSWPSGYYPLRKNPKGDKKGDDVNV